MEGREERERGEADDIRFDEIKRVLVVRLDEVTESEGSARERKRERQRLDPPTNREREREREREEGDT